MSSSSNSPASRRSFCLALLGLLTLPALAVAQKMPAELAQQGLQRWGSGDFRRFGLLIYKASLWAGDDPALPPRALRLDYQRRISGSAIVAASVDEMRKLGVPAAELDRWRVQMAALFPDVQPGDYLLGVHAPDGAWFFHNGRRLGGIADAEFARHFFAIWLDPRSSAPELRAQLLTRS